MACVHVVFLRLTCSSNVHNRICCKTTHLSGIYRSRRPISGPALNRGSRALRVKAIGFDLGHEPIKGVEKNAETLLRAANSLLIHQHVLKTKAAMAFTKVLLFLQRGGNTDAVLAAYGEFYAEITAANHASWQDLLLDEILAGRTPLAKAAARGTLGGQGPLRDAAAYDLDVLQRLSLAESTLAGWVSEAHRVPAGWLSAASAVGRVSLDSEDEAAGPGSSREEAAAAHIGAPLSSTERQMWRDRIGGSWKWSEALPDLLEFWSQHGFGLVAKHSALQWSGSSGGALTAASAGYNSQSSSVCTGEGNEAKWQALLEHAHAFLAAGSTSGAGAHAMLWDTSDANEDTSLVWTRLLQELGPEGLRLVRLPASELGSIDELGRTLKQHPRVRFVVLCDPFQVSSNSAATVVSALSGGGSWPANAALYTIIHGSRDEVAGAFRSFPASRSLLSSLENRFTLKQSWGS